MVEDIINEMIKEVRSLANRIYEEKIEISDSEDELLRGLCAAANTYEVRKKFDLPSIDSLNEMTQEELDKSSHFSPETQEHKEADDQRRHADYKSERN